ncbi:MAG: zinc-dependent metalloprotease [Propionibacteriaceae bacterium]|nr:zinc-dependent metalloprotease [Propionibacteriaceae bacterium]
MSQIIDWDVAARVGVALLRPGPKLTAPERAAAVTRLRAAAGRAAELVAEACRLPAAEAATHGTTLVVDRAGIVRANATAMSMALDGLTEDEASRLKALLQSAGAKVTGTGAGLVMAVIGGAILGQYEPFSNRLLLSAPSIEAVRAEIGASPDDFALWVCLHEQTHRHQFAAAPWMRDYMRELVRSAVSRDDEAPKGDAAPDGLGLIGAMADDGLKAVIGQVTALMSLLEGYADMLMDTSGAAVIPSLPTIRAQVDQRRRVKKHDLASVLRRAFGFEAKIDQYVVGKSFCEKVRQEVGMDGLNFAFTGRDTLPTVDELHHPEAWLARCQPHVLAG